MATDTRMTKARSVATIVALGTISWALLVLGAVGLWMVAL